MSSNMNDTITTINGLDTTFTYNSANALPNSIVIGAANPGYTITTTGNALDWGTISTDTGLYGSTLKVNGDADITGDIKIKGKSLSDRLDHIEQRLAILHPNKKLEEKWERLKALGDMYRELEQEIIEKEQIWSTLKK